MSGLSRRGWRCGGEPSRLSSCLPNLRLRSRTTRRNIAVDVGDDRAHLHCLPLLDHNLCQDPALGSWDLGIDLIGGDLQDWLIPLYGIADLLQPLGDRTFREGLAHLRHGDFDTRHVRLSVVPTTGWSWVRQRLCLGCVIRRPHVRYEDCRRGGVWPWKQGYRGRGRLKILLKDRARLLRSRGENRQCQRK